MKFVDNAVMVAQRIGGQVHLRSLRDAFATLMPFFVLAGLMVLVNNTLIKPDGVLSGFISNTYLAQWQEVGNSIVNGSLNFISVLIAGAIAYHLCQNKNYADPIAPVLLSIATVVIFMPESIHLTDVLTKQGVTVTGGISFASTGSAGMFVGILTGLAVTSLFIRLAGAKRLQVNISGDAIPPAVVRSFNTLIPIMLTMIIFALFSFAVKSLSGMDVNTLIATMIQQPLKSVTTSLPGFLLITTIANLFFSVGIHQGVISGAVLDPFLLNNMQENTLAFANHQEIPNIICMAFKDTFGVMGGSGNTIALLIAILLFSRKQDYRDIGKLSTAPCLFNISEPIIFGLPIVFNPALIIPFVLAPLFSLTAAYYATAWGWINHVTVQIPWTTPPILSGFLATGGDWRASVLQAVIIVITVFFYLPFLKFAERVAMAQAMKS
ncbi:PTS sugar transporter subunit IIC [Hafnia alvei]|uniref:Permease IIC component n=2 Tax=Hafnia alvei TaxID=569 RepID=A0A1C6Z0H3_HAFAL|nr:PTS transporter subunit EIIC [Hafnia alvei]SCM52505.1 PTS system, cellobiose-specific IIC component [Hafnia alvei]